MSNLKNKTRYLIASLLLLGFITYSSSIVLADDQTNYPPFVQTLADKLDVEETAVEDAFDEIRADQFAQRQQLYEDQLDKAVEAGVITEEQMNALMSKHEDMVFQEQQERKQHREEMQAWIAEQGIDQEALQQYMGMPGGHHHMGMGMMH